MKWKFELGYPPMTERPTWFTYQLRFVEHNGDIITYLRNYLTRSNK